MIRDALYTYFVQIPILTTKLYIPPLRTGVVRRVHLIERLNEGLAKGYKLTLISAPAGFGKTSLVSEWIAHSEWQRKSQVAWLSLEEGDSDPAHFIFDDYHTVDAISIGDALAFLIEHQPPNMHLVITNPGGPIAPAGPAAGRRPALYPGRDRRVSQS